MDERVDNAHGLVEQETELVNIQQRVIDEECDILGETNCDKLLALGVEFNKYMEKKINQCDIDFGIVQRLKSMFKTLDFLTVWSLFKEGRKYLKIDWKRVETCSNLGVELVHGDIILNNSQIDLQMLSDFKDMGVSLWEFDEDKVEVLSKMGKSPVVKENIQKMQQELDMEIWIREIAECSKLFLSPRIDWENLKIIHQQGWKLFPWMINILNTKQLYLKRWKVLQGWVKFDEMVKYNDMSLEEFGNKTKWMREMDRK